MTPEEAGKLLGICASFDNRSVDEMSVYAWYRVVGELSYAECEAAAIAHYSESREWIMPADVRSRVKAARRDRLAREVIPAPDADPDVPAPYRAALAAAVRRIADGLSTRKAIAAPVRQGPPPQEFTEAKAAMPQLGTKQERAALQAAQSRAEREAADRKETSGAGAQ